MTGMQGSKRKAKQNKTKKPSFLRGRSQRPRRLGADRRGQRAEMTEEVEGYRAFRLVREGGSYTGEAERPAPAGCPSP